MEMEIYTSIRIQPSSEYYYVVEDYNPYTEDYGITISYYQNDKKINSISIEMEEAKAIADVIIDKLYRR